MYETLMALYYSFFKIGLFGFGGGYAMISLIQEELACNNWLNLDEFLDIIAIAQMTPGPVSINSGTFVGYKISTATGSLIATLAVITPSFFMILLVARFFEKIKNSQYISYILRYLRPTVIGLIIAAALKIGKNSVGDVASVLIVLSVILIMAKTKIHPVIVIMLAGITGVIIYQ
ncbi:chromate transporter [Halothermothrix orenii]|uniref:Chromate transporter n=1 Tax=Halothermothrix orenii (strain H 168 / OCM 544 / DSM 9562) TaxID=373903 RepID=B8D1U0_HALOH|nr:chromate transporter [Halothermothrix orenii]ACL69167.1 Chromate transporter [Halothermothrix orenii H 168]